MSPWRHTVCTPAHTTCCMLYIQYVCVYYCVGGTCYVDLYNMQFCCTYLCRSKGCCLAVELFCTGIPPNLWVSYMCIIISMALNWNAPTLFHTWFEQATRQAILGYHHICRCMLCVASPLVWLCSDALSCVGFVLLAGAALHPGIAASLTSGFWQLMHTCHFKRFDTIYMCVCVKK